MRLSARLRGGVHLIYLRGVQMKTLLGHLLDYADDRIAQAFSVCHIVPLGDGDPAACSSVDTAREAKEAWQLLQRRNEPLFTDARLLLFFGGGECIWRDADVHGGLAF